MRKKREEIKSWLLENCVDEKGDLDLSNLDFSDFEGDVDISSMKVKGSLFQDSHIVEGDLFQSFQKVKANLFQGYQKVEGKTHE